MKHGSHIMLQRLVRSTVSTEPRPCLTVLLPWLCSFSSLCARMSRPGNTSSRCLKNVGSIAITSSKWPWSGQSFTIRILPSRSRIVALISPTFSLSRTRDVLLAVEDLLARLAHAGRAERVGLARPAERRLGLLLRLQQRLVGPVRRERGVLAGSRLTAREHLPERRWRRSRGPFSAYLIGACIGDSLLAAPRPSEGSGRPTYMGQPVWTGGLGNSSDHPPRMGRFSPKRQ